MDANHRELLSRVLELTARAMASEMASSPGGNTASISGEMRRLHGVARWRRHLVRAAALVRPGKTLLGRPAPASWDASSWYSPSTDGRFVSKRALPSGVPPPEVARDAELPAPRGEETREKPVELYNSLKAAGFSGVHPALQP